MERVRNVRRWIPWLIAYALLVVGVVFAMQKARAWALAELSTPESIAEWQTWREDVRRQQDQPGPVARQVPKSAEPPALVLLRDNFAVSLAGALVFSSALYWVLVWFVMGILKQP
jgi:hypothetical protein